jgi:hypothetical protein
LQNQISSRYKPTQKIGKSANNKKRIMNTKLLTTAVCGSLALAVASAPAASLTLTPTAPTPGTYDIYNFTGAAADGGNVNNGGTYLNGAANDGFTYVAGDQTTKGQTFTTGSLPSGYELSDIWIQHVGYTANGPNGDAGYNGTWWHMVAGSTLTIRVTNPSQAGTAGFVLASDTYATTGSEGWGSGYNNSDNGDGMWLQFSLATPVALTANAQYGFDLTSANNNAFFEWLGTDSDVFSGGGAYRGSTVATPDNALNALVGDRVFLLGLTPVPEPSTLALIGLGGLVVLLRRRSA